VPFKGLEGFLLEARALGCQSLRFPADQRHYILHLLALSLVGLERGELLDCLFGRLTAERNDPVAPPPRNRKPTIDEEITARAVQWMEQQAKADKPFFLWYNSTAMHFRTHVAEKNLGKRGQHPYSDRMVVHDEQIGMILDKLDELGIADNTIVMYSTDNGPENDTWPDGATTPFRSQKDTNWEGGWRVPAFIRWPGKIKAGTVFNGIVSHIDMFPTLLAAAGDLDVTQRLLKGTKVGDKTFNVHLDGYNMLPYFTPYTGLPELHTPSMT